MATAKQIEANRINAQKSTGPRSDEGKAASRANALTHGLSGAGVVLSEADRAIVDARLVAWAADLKSDTPRRRWLSSRAVIESVRIERCESLYLQLCGEHAERAFTCWDADRAREADLLYKRLAADPALIARQLEATPAGCDLMLMGWNYLAQALEDQGDWTESQRDDALDLLGHPRDYRGGETRVDPPAGRIVDLPTARRDLVYEQFERLKAARKAVLGVDWQRREAASRGGVGAELTAPVKHVIRLEAACHRRHRWAMSELDRRPEKDAVEVGIALAEVGVEVGIAETPAEDDLEFAVHEPATFDGPGSSPATATSPPRPAGNRRERLARKAALRRRG